MVQSVLGKLSITIKTALIFMLVGLFTIIVGISGFLGMSGVKESGDQIYNHYLSASNSLAGAESNLWRLILEQRNLMARQFETDISEPIAKIQQLEQGVMNFMNGYARVMNTDEERERYDRVNAAMNELLAINKRIVENLEARQGFKAVQISNEEFEPLLMTIIEQFTEMRNFNADEAWLYSESSDTTFDNTLGVLIGFIVLATIVVIGAWAFLTRHVSRSITRLNGAMQELADGTIDTDIPETDRGDELGNMAQTVLVFRDNLRTNAELARQTEEAAAFRQERSAKIEELTTCFDEGVQGFLDELSLSSTQLNNTAGHMTSAAGSAQEGVDGANSATGEASSSVNMVSAAANQLASSIAEIGQQAAQSSQMAQNAVNEAAQANELVQGLAASADKVGEVVSLISDIAEQTNLLALNATIEAARAGEAGKGFAVVASEVKNLANQTAKATEEISGQINEIQSSMKNTVGGIEMIVTTINEINANASTIAAAVEEQGAATQEIARSTDNASHSTETVAGNMSDVSGAIEQTSLASREVVEAADGVQKQSQSLRDFITRFLADMKAV